MTTPGTHAALTGRVRVSGLTKNVTEAQLRGLFLAHGPISGYDRPLDEVSGRPGPIAYLTMAARSVGPAVEAVHGVELGGAVLAVVALPVAVVPDVAVTRSGGSPTPRRVVLPPTEHELMRDREKPGTRTPR